MTWVNLRQDIGDIFAELVPTQYAVLLNGWMFKSPAHWQDDDGERYNAKRPSRSWHWQLALRLKESKRIDSRFHKRAHRRSNRIEVKKKRYACAFCHKPLDHGITHNVRKFCDQHCYRGFWDFKTRQAGEVRENLLALRQCVECFELFTPKNVAAKYCSAACRVTHCNNKRRKK